VLPSMIQWLVFALLTAAAIFVVVWPLWHARPASAADDVAVYQDQLEEIARDQSMGLIGEAEAEAARIEISRRLLAASEDTQRVAPAAQTAGPSWRRRAVAIIAIAGLPIEAGGLYAVLGSPGLPDQPLTARLHGPTNNPSIDGLVAQVESHLERKPEDGRGWEVLGPVYMRLGRFDDAVRARRNALRLLGDSAEREADLGEALVASSSGVVTADAKSAFERALQLDPHHVKSRFYAGLAAEQDGRREEAAATWRGLLEQAPKGAVWTEVVKQSLARVDQAFAASLPGPSADDVAAAADLTPEQRLRMVHTMVERLAARLAQDRSDIEGWLQLVRSYVVLGERDKAREAAAEAQKALAGEPDKVRRLEDLVKGLGLEG